MRHPRARSNSGMTIVEMAISCVVLALVFGSLAMSLSSSRSVFERGSRTMTHEQDSSRVLRQVTDALRGADAASLPLVPPAPLSASTIDFQTQQGYQGKSWTWSPPRRIGYDAATGTVRRIDDFGLPGQKVTVWADNVPALLEGEIANGADDNGNGLIDEAGFCVTREGNMLVLRVTIAGQGQIDGDSTRTAEVRIALRN